MLCFQNDPFWTAGSLSRSDYLEAANQSVCKLADMLEVIKDNTSLILNFQNLPPAHPYYSTYINITLETILASGIRQQAVSSVGVVMFQKLLPLWVLQIHKCVIGSICTLDLKCHFVPRSYAGADCASRLVVPEARYHLGLYSW